jgi:dTDP-4-dehydrorhamnose reductase
LTHATLDLLVDRATGIWHIAGDGAVSWEHLACAAARRAGYEVTRIQRQGLDRCAAPRPNYSALGSERARLLPHWEHALDRYFAEVTNSRHEFCGLAPV